MSGGEHVVHVLATVDGGVTLEAIDHGRQAVEDLDAGLLQLHAHGDGEKTTDDARDDRENQVERPDILVVGGIHPATHETLRLVVVIVVSDS
jgi:hypothetical protein